MTSEELVLLQIYSKHMDKKQSAPERDDSEGCYHALIGNGWLKSAPCGRVELTDAGILEARRILEHNSPFFQALFKASCFGEMDGIM